MPESVEAAMEYIKGYCLKHPYCENNGNVCRLYEKATGRCFLCSDMMDYQEAINALKLERISLEGKPRRVADFCEALNVAVSAMQELQQYKQIGTLEEVREAVEKQRKMKPEDEEYCPICHTFLKDEDDVPGFYCMNCGQAIYWKDWSEEE